ncbi:MAG: ribonuclease III [Saprospiraceae bacterium]|nr:ribonuclease III [Bacteroidia bacterium]MBT8229378.1 ribonuclease III [Bacteroidia bacterium]NNF23041.1 ribonuclease III [Saprospiraceae bacterium]NNK89843.1 ribonuclease III [Saprospiraceae bacterium]
MHLFKLAFFHKSMNNGEQVFRSYNNERLEYLGDAVLSTVVAEYLYQKYPGRDEGFLTKMRSKIVKRKTLNKVAEKMGIDLILTKYTQGKISYSMLGNAFEAMVGALYIEYGYDRTRDYVISKILMRYLDIHDLETSDDNYKSQLLEWGQKEGRLISYKLVSKFKLDKRDRFRISVYLDGEEISTAEDFNKKSAEQIASSFALKNLNIRTQS